MFLKLQSIKVISLTLLLGSSMYLFSNPIIWISGVNPFIGVFMLV